MVPAIVPLSASRNTVAWYAKRLRTERSPITTILQTSKSSRFGPVITFTSSVAKTRSESLLKMLAKPTVAAYFGSRVFARALRSIVISCPSSCPFDSKAGIAIPVKIRSLAGGVPTNASSILSLTTCCGFFEFRNSGGMMFMLRRPPYQWKRSLRANPATRVHKSSATVRQFRRPGTDTEFLLYGSGIISEPRARASDQGAGRSHGVAAAVADWRPKGRVTTVRSADARSAQDRSTPFSGGTIRPYSAADGAGQRGILSPRQSKEHRLAGPRPFSRDRRGHHAPPPDRPCPQPPGGGVSAVGRTSRGAPGGIHTSGAGNRNERPSRRSRSGVAAATHRRGAQVHPRIHR